MTEFDFIHWLAGRSGASPALTVPIGDDCAGLNLAGRGDLLITTDIRLDGTHFLTAEHTPAQIGYKCLACSLSDIAAMAAVPVGAVVAVALPRNRTAGLPQQLHAGMAPLIKQFACPLIGGDTTTWNGPLAICVTCLGVPDGLGPIRRSGAKPGDLVCVTGPLGGSILGKHLSFTPRVAEARKLAAALPLHSMMDISDGLAGDLRRICEQSNVAAELDEASLLNVASADAITLAARDGRSLLDHVLSDGEDFELLFTVPAGTDVASHGAMVVGRVLAGEPALFLRRTDGCTEPLSARGYEHA